MIWNYGLSHGYVGTRMNKRLCVLKEMITFMMIRWEYFLYMNMEINMIQ
jgi:hypothetical protein